MLRISSCLAAAVVINLIGVVTEVDAQESSSQTECRAIGQSLYQQLSSRVPPIGTPEYFYYLGRYVPYATAVVQLNHPNCNIANPSPPPQVGNVVSPPVGSRNNNLSDGFRDLSDRAFESAVEGVTQDGDSRFRARCSSDTESGYTTTDNLGNLVCTDVPPVD